MDLTLNLNSRLQPMHRHDLEDALQEILEKGKLGEVTGGGTLQRQTGEIVSCDIEIHLNDDKQDSVNRLVELMNIIGIPKGSALLCTVPEIKAMSPRLEVAHMLSNNCVYSDIVAKTGASTATISRVNRSLNYGCDGYELVFGRLQEEEEATS